LKVEENTQPTAAEIVRIGHPALRSGTNTVPSELIGTRKLDELIDIMRATLQGRGVGLAAPQLAVPLRLFVIEDMVDYASKVPQEEVERREITPYPFEVIINPIWRATSPETVIFREGCLSIPGFTADVPRYREIEVEGLTHNGVSKLWRLKGWPARIFQHEIDHLDGRLFVDAMQPRTLAVTENYGSGLSFSLSTD
jgi:peptide deformylase